MPVMADDARAVSGFEMIAVSRSRPASSGLPFSSSDDLLLICQS